MSFDYAGLATRSLALITKFGADFTFTTFSLGSYDPATNTTTKTPSNYTAKCVKTNFTAQERADGSIQTGDIKLIAEVATFAIGDEVAVNSDTYRIQDINPIEPAGVPVIYILQVRK